MSIRDISLPQLRDLSWDKVKYFFLPRTRDQQLLYAFLLIVLTLTIVVPVAAIFIFSFASEFPIRGAFGFTFDHYLVFVGNLSLLYDITINTFYYAGGATFLGMVIGLFAAIYAVKYMGGSKLQLFMLIPYGIPSVAALTGWILLLGEAGLITQIVMDLFNLSSQPWSIYSIPGMIFVEGIHIAPVAFLLTLPALRNVPAALDEASLVSGASRLRTFRKVVLPVIWPSILSTFIFLFVRTMATVATPSVLGVPSQTYTFGSAIPYLFLSGTEVSYSNALSFSVLITLVTTVFILYYLKVQEQEGKFTTVIGTGDTEPLTFETSPLKKTVGVSVFVGYLIVGGALPFMAIIWSSILPASMLTLEFAPGQITLANYVGLFNGTAPGVFAWWSALQNTLLLSVSVPTIAMTICLLIAYSNQTLKIPLRRSLALIASVPLAIPGIARSMGYVAAFIQTPVYGTFWILFIAFHGYAIPIGMRYASPALTRIGVENTEASILSGAGAVRSFRKITMPLVSEDYIAGWMHMFVGIVRNVSIPILLYTSGSEVVAVELLNVLRAGYAKTAATIAVIITLLSIVPYMGLQYYRIYRRERDDKMVTAE
jgi:iron(III) transport system permease protein